MTPAGLQLHEKTEKVCFTEARAHLAKREDVKPMKMERDWETWKEGPHAATKAVQKKPCGQRANQDGHVVSLRAVPREGRHQHQRKGQEHDFDHVCRVSQA